MPGATPEWQPLAACCGVPVAVLLLGLPFTTASKNRRRRQRLVERYGEEAAGRIVAKELWQGATREMVEEMWGKPESVDDKVTKNKTTHVLKYLRTGKNRYGLRVTLEDGVVTGWESNRG